MKNEHSNNIFERWQIADVRKANCVILENMSRKIGDTISIKDIGFMGLETWVGIIVGTTYKYYIIDFGEDTKCEQRFQIRQRKDYD